MEKKNYERIELENLEFFTEDVLTTSLDPLDCEYELPIRGE